MFDDEEDPFSLEGLIGDADLDEGIDEGEEDTREPETDGGDDEQAAAETQARALGWKPKSEWKGDQSGWVDAGEFLDQVKPARLRDTLHKTSKELAELKQQREAEKRDFEDRLARLDKVNAKALARQKEQLVRQVKAAQRQAAEAGDVEAFDHFQEQEAQIAEHFAEDEKELEQAAPQKQAATQGKPDPTVDAWVKKNPAIRFSGPKWQAAVAFFDEAEAENPGGTVADHLAHVEARLNEVWPGTVRGKAKQNGNGAMNGNKRDDDKGQRSPQTERSGRMAARTGPRGKGWTDIPAAERNIMARHIKEGLYENEAAAAKAYWS
jgi:hypothetical protein